MIDSPTNIADKANPLGPTVELVQLIGFINFPGVMFLTHLRPEGGKEAGHLNLEGVNNPPLVKNIQDNIEAFHFSIYPPEGFADRNSERVDLLLAHRVSGQPMSDLPDAASRYQSHFIKRGNGKALNFKRGSNGRVKPTSQNTIHTYIIHYDASTKEFGGVRNEVITIPALSFGITNR